MADARNRKRPTTPPTGSGAASGRRPAKGETDGGPPDKARSSSRGGGKASARGGAKTKAPSNAPTTRSKTTRSKTGGSKTGGSKTGGSKVKANGSKRSRADEVVDDAAAPELERRVPEAPPPFPTATQLEQAVVGGTAVFTIAAALTAALPDTFVAVGVGVSLALFAVGCVTFLAGYARAVPRSRRDDIALGGLFFLSGSAPKRVQRTFLICLAVQIVVGITAASIRPFTPVAFATLVPMFALGLATLWGATFGAFPPRVVARPRGER